MEIVGNCLIECRIIEYSFGRSRQGHVLYFIFIYFGSTGQVIDRAIGILVLRKENLLLCRFFNIQY